MVVDALQHGGVHVLDVALVEFHVACAHARRFVEVLLELWVGLAVDGDRFGY